MPVPVILSPNLVMVAILVRDKAYSLPLFLECLLSQTYPKSKTFIYIRSNDNSDCSEALLKEWVEKHGSEYAGVYANYEPFKDALEDSSTEWTPSRFAKLGKIRQDSADYAKEHGYDYFVIDSDNFIAANTISRMVSVRAVGVVAPILYLPGKLYSNYHSKCTPTGYYDDSDRVRYTAIWNRSFTGLIKCDVVHCTYYIAHEFLKHVKYLDSSGRFEYVIFSDFMRQAGVGQYIDTRSNYGYLTLLRTAEEFIEEELPGYDRNILANREL